MHLQTPTAGFHPKQTLSEEIAKTHCHGAWVDIWFLWFSEWVQLLNNCGGVLGGFNHPRVKALNINRTVFLVLTKDVQTQNGTHKSFVDRNVRCLNSLKSNIRNMLKKAKHLDSEGNIN